MSGSEADLPVSFSKAAAGAGSRPQRLLDSFTLHEPGRPHLLVPVDALKDRNDAVTAVASGQVVQLSQTGGDTLAADAGGGRVSITTGPVLDWCLQYGDRPAVWIITARAWYKLVQPSSQYSGTYASVQAKVDLCVRCRAALLQQPSAPVDAVQQSVLAGQRLGGSSSTTYTMQQLLTDVQFLAGQMKTLQQSGAFKQQGAPAGSMPFLDWLDYQAAYAAAAAAAAGEGAGGDGPAAKRRRLSELSGTQGPPSGAAAGAPPPAAARGANTAAAGAGGGAAGAGAGAGAGPFKLGSKLKIKFKSAQQTPAEPAADRSSQVQGAAAAAAAAAVPAPAPAAAAPPAQLQRQPSVPASQVTGGTTGQSQRGPLVKTKIKFTLPKGPRPGAALAGLAGAAGGSAAAAPSAAAAAAAAAAATPPAGHVQAGPGGAYAMQGAPSWDAAAAYGQPAAPRQVQRVSASGASRSLGGPPSARATAASSRAAEAAARKAAKEREAQLKREAESQADAARGPPPPPTRSFRLPGWAVGEVLTLWELCQCFAAALQLPSFPCELLEAALLPGPLNGEEKAATAAELAAAADAEAVTARAALAAAAAEAAAAAAVPAEPETKPQEAAGKADTAAAPQQEQQQQETVPGSQVKQEPQADKQQQQEGGDAMQVDGTQEQPNPNQQQQQPQVKQEPEEKQSAAAQPSAAAGTATDAEAPAAVKQEGAAGAAAQQPQQQPSEPAASDMQPAPPQQQPGSQPSGAAAAAAAAAAEPTASASTCTASVAPTASNSMGTPSGKTLKLKVKLGKVQQPPQLGAAEAAAAAGAAAGAGEGAAGGGGGAAAAAGAAAGQQQQQQPGSLDPAAAAAMGLPAVEAAAAPQQDPQQQQQQQGGTAWMAQAQAAALAAAAAVSTAAIKAADAAGLGGTQEPPSVQQLQAQDAVGITDAACLPSSLLLRDMHTGLMRLTDGTGPKPGKRGLKPPPTARLCPTESQRQLAVLLAAPHWAHKASQVVKQAGAVVTGPEAQEAAKQLLQSDYALLSLEPRLSILRCLTDFAFVSELARSHLTARNDAHAAARALGKGGCSHNTFSMPPAPGPGADAGAAAEHATAVKMLEEWVEWVEMLSHQAALSTEPIPTIGLRRPLGTDHRRRRYWALGGAAGAWRVYCEEGDGSNWGYYEGVQLVELTRWLAGAALESEGALLATLCSMPWPYRPSLVTQAAKAAATAAAASAGVPEPQSPNSFSYWAGFAAGHPGSSMAPAGPSAGAGAQAIGLTAMQAGVQPVGAELKGLGLRLPHAQQLMGSADMQRRRPNGYLRLVAPALYGEADIPGGSILGTTDERLRLGVDCLMSQVPFWLPGQAEVVTQLVTALEHLQGGPSPGAFTQALTHLELAMSSPSLDPHSPLEPDWHSTWKQAWRDSLASCQPPSWEAVGLHLSMMGRHVVPRPLSMSREAFFTTVEGSRCKLGFPAVGEVVCVVRSGCLLHLRHYAQLPDYATAPLPPPAAELNAAADVVKTLPPVSKYKVVAVAYCQYPKPTPPPVVQQLEPAGSAQLGQASAGAAGQPPQQQFQQPPGPAGAVGQQQQGQGQQGGAAGGSKSGSRGSKKRRRSKSLNSGWGLGYDEEEDEEEGSGESEDESESNSEEDEYNDRNIRLTGIDSDADGLSSQQPLGSQSQQQQASQQQLQAQQQANGNGAGQPPAPQQPQQQVVVQQRPPCMWVLLSPISPAGGSAAGQPKAPGQPKPPTPSPPPGSFGEQQQDQLEDFLGDHQVQQQPEQQQRRQQKLPCLVVPLHIDSGLPDYLVQPSMYDASLQRRWLPQDRCSMYIGGRQRGGVAAMSAAEFAQGTIIEIEEPLPGEGYDPWQSITVLWDDEWSHLNLRSKVSPWDVDTDVEERVRQEEEARKAAAAAAAAEELARQEAAAEAARQKRRQNQRARFDQIGDLGVAAAERDDDDDYNPEDDSSDSEGGRRGRKARLARMQAAAMGSGAPPELWDPAVPRKRGRPPGPGRGNRSAGGPGLTWSAGGGRGGRGGAAALAPASGVAWTREQVLQQQQVLLDPLQRAMAAAMASGNEQGLQQLKATGLNGKILPTPLPLEVLVDLPAELEFLILVAAYKNSQKPGFVPPSINNRELDLYTLFMVVNVRGGYEAVCTSFRWGDVCRSLGCDGGVQTQTNMRIAYERALLEFEQYVRCGRYLADRATNQAPAYQKSDNAAAMEQCVRAGKVAAAQQSAPSRPAAGPRGALPLVQGAAGAAGLMALPGGLQGVQLNPVLAAQAQLAAQLRLQQQAQLLAAQKAGTAGAAAGLRPAQAGAQQPQAVNVQQQLLMQQQLLQRAQLAQLQAAGNPQLQALLLQQQQAQLAAAAAGGARPVGTAAPAGVLTLAQIQQLQQLQRAGAAAAAPQPAAAGAAAAQPAASQALPSASSGVNFSAMLDDV